MEQNWLTIYQRLNTWANALHALLETIRPLPPSIRETLPPFPAEIFEKINALWEEATPEMRGPFNNPFTVALKMGRPVPEDKMALLCRYYQTRFTFHIWYYPDWCF